MKAVYMLLLFALFCSVRASANNVQISNVSVVNNGPGNIQIQFDVSWDNSWRVNVGPANYDGVWVFFKYKDINGLWKPIYLTGNYNVVPVGVSFYQTNDVNKTGVMVYPSANSSGTMTVTGARVGTINSLPYDIDVRGFAIEMVYIPVPTARPFFGDGDGTNESTNAFHYTNNTATTSSVVPMLVDANAGDDAELDADGIYMYSNDTIQTTNPLGSLDPFPTMKALWCMKYEINQAQYRDFLNTLTLAQQTTRTEAAPTSAVGTKAMVPSSLVYRNNIEIKTPSTGGLPAEYGCDANNNNVYDEAADGEWIACNWLYWTDVAAYLDWSGLAPMTEITYERICRGHSSAGAQPAVYGEYAWGNTNIFSSVYTPSNRYEATEIMSNASTNLGNAMYTSTYFSAPDFGPVRSGVFATGTSNRTNSGASFFGVMEMSGNIAEYCISIGTAAGRSTRYVPNGNGSLSAAGNAQLSVGGAGFWPGMEGNTTTSTINNCSGTCEITGNAGIIVRGGFWYGNANQLRVSDRSANSSPSLVTRHGGYGGRGVLYLR